MGLKTGPHQLLLRPNTPGGVAGCLCHPYTHTLSHPQASRGFCTSSLGAVTNPHPHAPILSLSAHSMSIRGSTWPHKAQGRLWNKAGDVWGALMVGQGEVGFGGSRLPQDGVKSLVTVGKESVARRVTNGCREQPSGCRTSPPLTHLPACHGRGEVLQYLGKGTSPGRIRVGEEWRGYIKEVGESRAVRRAH